jgi:hypothetical protein
MSDFKYEIVKQVAILNESKGYTKEINLIKYGDKEPMLDIRKWNRNDDTMQKGIALSKEEAQKLKEALATLDF